MRKASSKRTGKMGRGTFIVIKREDIVFEGRACGGVWSDIVTATLRGGV